MPHPLVSFSSEPFRSSTADALVLAVPTLKDAAAELAEYPGLAEALEAIGFTGSSQAFARVHAPDVIERAFAVVGIGAHIEAQSVREAVGTALRSLTGFTSVAVSVLGDAEALAAAEGAALGGYAFPGYKSSPGPARAAEVTVHTITPVSDGELTAVRTAADAVALAKDLAGMPADRLGPSDLADRAIAAVDGLGVEVTVLDEHELAAGGYGGILGVGRGSARPPRLVKLDYSPASATRHIALVGKGIVFDTGGLSLKPAGSMVGMNDDMAGAAASLAVLRAVAGRGLPVRVTTWLCIAENMPSGTATRPGDVLTMLDGTTVEVLNTDAEGRLVLADGLAAAGREHPDVIVDIATLTGAMVVALGSRHTGVMGSEEAVDAFLGAARRTGEDAWPLPLPAHMVPELESGIADLRNAKVGDRAAGSLFAGLFLQHFVARTGNEDDSPRIPWVHLDIAGTSVNASSGWGFTDKGPTGAMVRTLIDFIAAGGQ